MKFNYTVFSTENNRYFFDGVSGNIFAIEESLFNNHEHLFKHLHDDTYKLDKEFSSQYEEILEAAKNKLIMSPSKGEFNYWFDINKYKQNRFNEINHLMIGVTEKCNMRCKYCIYGGHYENERIHSNVDINYDTLKDSIDYFFKISNSEKKIINFYGGEPFVNFEAIKKIVQYINGIDSKVQIYITTNGILLNEEVSEWFSKNENINLFISLAGIPKRHDELRVLANEKPTFDIIRKNLMHIRQIDFNSYKNRINFVFNIFDEIQLLELQSFWDQDEMFEGLNHLPEVTFIDCADDDGAINDMRENISNKYPEAMDPLKEYIKLLKEKNYNNLITKHFDNKLLHIHRRLTNCDDNILSGVCRPFVHKMFVDVHGNMNLCENFSYGTNFGTIYSEFPSDSVDKLLTLYKSERSKTCTNCWASKICSLCFRDIIDRNGSVNSERAETLCKDERASMQRTLTEYCTVLENDSSLLNHLDDYILHM
jgi:uncharacterized protein